MEANMQVLEGAQYRLRVKLTNKAGELLPPELFRVYGGAFCPGCAPAHFQAERTAEEWVLTIPGLKPGRVPWNWQVIAAEYATGVEWLLAAGEVHVTPRLATGSGYVDPGELMVTATLDKTTLQMTVTLGESTAACSLAVVDARQSAAAAAASEQASANSAGESAASASAAADSAHEADGRADDASASAADAQTYAGQAAGSATEAAEYAAEAATSATAAAASATQADKFSADAAASAAMAAGSASEAAGHAESAQAAAQTAAAQAVANVQGQISEQVGVAAGHASAAAGSATEAAEYAAEAAISATAAANSAVDADRHSADAAASAAMAAGSASAAANSATAAEAAQSKAEEEAVKAEQNAALLGDAALKGADNTFTGFNTFNGEVAGVLPWDFHAYSWCKNREQLYAACPDIEQRTVFCADLSNMNEQDGNFLLPKNIKKAVLYFSGEVQGRYSIGSGLKGVVIYAPNATANNSSVGIGSGSTYTLFAPNSNGFSRFGIGSGKVTVFAICAVRTVNADFCGGHWYQWATRDLIMPLNVVRNLDLPMGEKLRNVPVGFPLANYINMNAAKLNKTSVMAILNALKPYDAATMNAVPELTLGIDPTLDGDEEINSALLNAQEAVENGGKGWNVAVAGFTVTAGGGATMALRKPIYAQRRAADDGAYVDAAGTRWSVRYGNTVLANWAANEELGYTEFPNLESALAEWGLTEYVPEVPEETLTNN